MARIKIWTDTRGFGACNSCEAALEWAEVVASGKRMPFDRPIVTVATETDSATGRQIETVDTSISKSHFANCPDRDKWRKK